jgi:hypothetical protein
MPLETGPTSWVLSDTPVSYPGCGHSFFLVLLLVLLDFLTLPRSHRLMLSSWLSLFMEAIVTAHGM